MMVSSRKFDDRKSLVDDSERRFTLRMTTKALRSVQDKGAKRRRKRKRERKQMRKQRKRRHEIRKQTNTKQTSAHCINKTKSPSLSPLQMINNAIGVRWFFQI